MGTLTDCSSGSCTYTPTAGYLGPDSFTWKANDGTSDSNVATFSITVIASTQFARSDVMAGVGDGSVNQFDPTAVLKNTLFGTPSTGTSGMAFDSSGDLYVTDFEAGNVA
jgi:hypothetical protein